MSIINDGGTLAGATAAVRLAYTSKYNKYIILQNTDSAEDIWYGHSEANTVSGKAFVLGPGLIAAINTNDGSGNLDLWAMAAGAFAATYTVSTNGTIV